MKSKPSNTLATVSLLAVLGALVGCTSLESKRERIAAQSNAKPRNERIDWPANYLPEKAVFFVHNEIEIAAPPQVVWEILLEAENWPEWYLGARKVRIIQPPGSKLAADGVFIWNTMDLDFESQIKQFQPPFRLSWESKKPVIRGYHAWLIIPTEGGCRVITDESQHGPLAVAEKIFVPNQLRQLHDVWLAELKKKAEASSQKSG